MSDRVTVIIVAKSWPSWGVVAEAAGFFVVALVLLELTWKNWCEKNLKGVKTFTYEEFVMDASCTYRADVVISDVDLPSGFLLWDRVEGLYIGRRSVRHPKSVPRSFSFSRFEIPHVRGGGVSDGVWGLNFYVKESYRWYLDLLPTVAIRDMSGIINSTAGYGLSCIPPPKITHLKPKVVMLRPRTFHGGGLFPFNDRSAYFVVPSVFTKTNWCRRRLTGEETLLSLDVGEAIIADLTSEQKAKLCNDLHFIPSKTTLQVLQGAHRMLMGKRESPYAVSYDTNTAKGECIHRTGKEPNPLEDRGIEPPEDVRKGAEAEGGKGPGYETDKDRTKKATKSDDAAVPVHLWNQRIVGDATFQQAKALDRFRQWAFDWWKRNIVKEFVAWFRKKHNTDPTVAPDMTEEAKRDLVAGRDCLKRSVNSTFWEWTAGSRPYFWRWPVGYQKSIRDGIPVWIKGDVIKWRRPQKQETDPRLYEGMRTKVKNVCDKDYVEWGEVFSLTSFFAVPKGEFDIRMVYDGTKSGFNGSCWAPWFMLPTIEQHLRATEAGSHMGDIDIGEMFLNFILNEEVRKYCGVDLTKLFPEEVEPGKVLWKRWGRCGMGFTFSPYQAVQGVLWAEEFIVGPGDQPGNPFNFEHVELNLPGRDDYQPWKPWVYKVKVNGQLAAELLIYVDDVRVIEGEEKECWEASHWVASKLNYLGLQDAARKRREPLQEPGAWAGSNVHTIDGVVCIMITQERWDKMKSILQWILEELRQQSGGIEHKTLERYRGVLVYISRTYPAIVPYLKGIHLTLDSWRPWRKNDGWKMTSKEVRAYQIEHGWEEAPTGIIGKPPKRVKAATRLRSDVEALITLTKDQSPPRRKTRPTATVVALYGFADASGKGFGSSLFVEGKIHFRHGQWSDEYDEESSNFRELDNLVTAIEEAYQEGLLNNCELFMFTDNSTAESAFYKGTSTVEHLFNLVLRLRCLQMTGDFSLHVIHCAGTRMKAQGTDGLSRADLTEGVMKGTDILTFVPLHLSAVERNPKVVSWVNEWFGEEGATWLTPRQWYLEGQLHSRCIWYPPPAAADVAVEQLAKSKHKRPEHVHVVIVPRLLTSKWRKLLSKVCDIVITVPVGTDVWDYSLYEPLIVAIAFPIIKHRPWRLKGTLLMERAEGLLRELPKATPEWGRSILCELCTQARRLDELPEGVVRSLLRGHGTN